MPTYIDTHGFCHVVPETGSELSQLLISIYFFVYSLAPQPQCLLVPGHHVIYILRYLNLFETTAADFDL